MTPTLLRTLHFECARRRRALPALAILIVAGIVLWPTWLALTRVWHDSSDYSHGYLVVVIVAVWIVIRTADLPLSSERFSPLACVLLVTCILVWMVAYRAASDIGQQMMLPLILWLAVRLAGGPVVASRIAPALLFLYFAIPVWDLLLPSLQQLTVWVARGILGSFGIPVAIDGVNITIPEGRFRIAEGCSGKNYLLVALGLAALYCELEGLRRMRAVAYLSITAALALVVNWLRVLVVIYAGHATQMRHYLVAREHITFGWLLFAILLALVLFAGSRFARTDRGSTRSPLAEPLAPGNAWTIPRPQVVATTLLLSLPLLAVAHVARPPRAAAVENFQWPRLLGGSLDGPQLPGTGWTPRYAGATSISQAQYTVRGWRVETFAAVYATQAQGAELVSFRNSLLGDRWIKVRVERMAAATDAQFPLDRVQLVEAETPTGDRWLVGYVYRVDGFVTGSAAMAQVAYGVLAWFHPARSSIVASAVFCGQSCDAAPDVLASFWRVAGPQLILSAR